MIAIILRSRRPKLSNNIIQKGLAFGRDWSGSVVNSGRQGRFEILPRRLDGRGGASVVRRNAAIDRTEDLDVKVREYAISCIIGGACSCCKALAGATIAAMVKATGWQRHSVRGFLAGVVRKRLKLKLSSNKVDGNRVYQIASGDSGKPTSRQPKRRSP